MRLLAFISAALLLALRCLAQDASTQRHFSFFRGYTSPERLLLATAGLESFLQVGRVPESSHQAAGDR
jgi:hypothetical protein